MVLREGGGKGKKREREVRGVSSRAKERGRAGKGGVGHKEKHYRGNKVLKVVVLGRCVPGEPLVTVAPNRIRKRIKSSTH